MNHADHSPSGGAGRRRIIARAASRTLILVGALAAPGLALADDRKAPAAPTKLQVGGGEDWTTHRDFAVSWTNPDHQSAIDNAYYRLCPVDGQRACDDSKVGGRGIHQLRLSVPAPGDYTLSVWLKDERGHVDPGNRSRVVHLRYDDQPPTSPGIESGAGGDPAVLSVQVADKLSGPGKVELELRRADGGDWTALPTEAPSPDRATARIQDLELADGTYEVRALVRDVAGNLAVIDRDTDGQAMRLTLPVRKRTGIAAATTVTRVARQCRSVLVRVAGHARRRLVCRNLAVSQPVSLPTPAPLRVPQDQRLLISGVLDDAPDGAVIDVVQRPRTPGSPVKTARVALDSAGRFQVPLEPGPSRTVELSYAGDAQSLPSTTQLSLLVPASSSLGASRRSALNGQAVRFTGRLLGDPVPEIGRTVDLQAYYRGAWRTFATPRTDSTGAWSWVYRFGATRGVVTYPFRVLVQRDAGYPYETGVSRTVRVVVRGR